MNDVIQSEFWNATVSEPDENIRNMAVVLFHEIDRFGDNLAQLVNKLTEMNDHEVGLEAMMGVLGITSSDSTSCTPQV